MLMSCRKIEPPDFNKSKPQLRLFFRNILNYALLDDMVENKESTGTSEVKLALNQQPKEIAQMGKQH